MDIKSLKAGSLFSTESISSFGLFSKLSLLDFRLYVDTLYNKSQDQSLYDLCPNQYIGDGNMVELHIFSLINKEIRHETVVRCNWKRVEVIRPSSDM